MQIPDILNLGCTSKFFAAVSSDDTFWQRRLQTDYNFSGAGTARTSGWKLIYRGIFKPRVYVWGERSNGRLGLSEFPTTSMRAQVPFPVQLRIPGIRIVSLVAGGMSFHALDSEGQIYVWGTLDPTMPFLRNSGFAQPGQIAKTPLRLRMPAVTRSVSCGRLHASTLDSDGQIWTFPSWGRPFRLVSDFFTDPNSKPLQIECGWGFSCVLTVSGEVFVWWPFSGETAEYIEATNTQMNEQGDKEASALTDYSIPCVTWDLIENPTRLPSIPLLPELPGGDNEKPVQLIQIAGLDAQIVGLTNKGQVLKFNSLSSKETSSAGRWEYLQEFSSIENIHAEFSRLGLESPGTLKITHISANFMSFIAYSTGSSSVVLIGNTETTPHTPPKIIPELQHKSIISVVLGDYHNAALTSSGKVLTWGAYSAGALGLGDPAELPIGAPGGYLRVQDRTWVRNGGEHDPPAVDVPSEVRFDHNLKSHKDRFCFSIAAAGWHTGALVMDLESEEEEEEDEPEPEDRLLCRHMYEQPHTLPGHSPPFSPSTGIRIGFAGRGGAIGPRWGIGRGRGT
ncbi:SCF-associated factor 1 [Termitomyces sp. J132]|nr:SCF-associated factor 1 [Termitomyces sp. J132]